MSDHPLKPSELKFLLRKEGIKRYNWKSCLRGGHFPLLLLERTVNKQQVIGKIVSVPSEGEINIWSQLKHRNINCLIETLHIRDNVKILISPFIGKCIGTLIDDNNFNNHPLCFDRKRKYVRDILSALSYMHERVIFHLNLNEESISVCSNTDKAVLCDFTYVTDRRKITKSSLPPNSHYKPPEIQYGTDKEWFDSLPIDIWDCGILFLQIFTQHLLPCWDDVEDSLELLNIEILKKANAGANLRKKLASEFKVFIQHLLSKNPELRPSVEDIFQLGFLQTAYERLDKKARYFWKTGKELDSFNNNSSFFEGLSSSSDLNVDHTDIKCTKLDKPHLVKAKSELGCKMHEEVLNGIVPRRASFPQNLKNSEIESSASSSEESVATNHTIVSESKAYCHNISATASDDLDQAVNDLVNAYGHSTDYCFSTHCWDADNLPNVEDDSSYLNSSWIENEDGKLLKTASYSLEQMIPSMISMTASNLDATLLNSSDSLSTALENIDNIHPNSEPNICKVRWSGVQDKQRLSLSYNNKNLSCHQKKLEMTKHTTRSDSPILVDRRDLYNESEIITSDDNQRCFENTICKRKKWYHKLFCCYCKTN